MTARRSSNAASLLRSGDVRVDRVPHYDGVFCAEVIAANGFANSTTARVLRPLYGQEPAQ